MRTLANQIFKSYLPSSELKEEQWLAIQTLMEGNRALVIQPTGWGKSVVYFVAAKLMRIENRGLTIIVSPLLALIRNQLDAAKEMGLNAFTINSDNEEEWEDVNNAIKSDSCDILLVSPERLQSKTFIDVTLPLIEMGPKIGLMVIDEAHCISDWGNDFRPKYKKIVKFVNMLQRQIPMLATTATANERVEKDIESQLGENIKIFRGALVRQNLILKILPIDSVDKKLAWLKYHLTNGNLDGAGIIYCTTQKQAERVAAWLRHCGISAEHYHRGVDLEVKKEIEGKLIRNELKVVVATIALGMGYDKKDIRFVIHYNMSTSIIAYYQEIGRAGRDNLPADVILLYSEKDMLNLKNLLKSGITSEVDYFNVLNFIEKNPGNSINGIMSNYNLGQTSINKILDLLQAEELIYKNESKFYRSGNFADSLLQNKEILQQKLIELDEMQKYANNPSECLMNVLINNLGDNSTVMCGVCQNCFPNQDQFSFIQEEDVSSVNEYIKAQSLKIKPKSRWPYGINNLRGGIPIHLRAEEGLALSMYQDEGIGELVYVNRYVDKWFSDQLVDYCSDFILNNMLALNNPTCIVTIPSLRNPELVTNFAERVANKVGLPFSNVLIKVKNTQEQKDMRNSQLQVTNILDSFEVENPKMLTGNVLLIDDIMNSGWTFTICAKKLLEAGFTSVTPLALSKT